jgi:nitric oxide reductase subunit B
MRSVDTLDTAHERSRPYRGLWVAFAAVIAGSFAVLGIVGVSIDSNKPPIPSRVVSDGQLITTRDEILDGQNVWQSLGGHEVGSIWGHSAYAAPDWTADYLHREATFVLDRFAQGEGASSFDELGSGRQAALRQRLENTFRRNTYDKAAGVVTLAPVRA